MTSGRRRPILPWILWVAAVLAQIMAIVHRSSLAALGPATQRHFDIDATTLSMFAVIQLVIVALLQVPIGMLLDRFGPTALILSGGLLMVCGQVAMATVSDVRLALVARILVGAGDACTFISVIRLLPEWFSLKQLPTITQLTGLLGQMGQILSVAPLALAVGAAGWTSGFIGVAAVGFIVVLLGVLVLRDRPGKGTVVERLFRYEGRATREAVSFAENESLTGLQTVAPPATGMIMVVDPSRRRRRPDGLSSRVRSLVKLPGVRLAYWILFTSPFSSTVLLMLWGTPFLTGGVGLDRAASASLLSLAVVSGMIAGVIMGPLTARFREKRVWIVVGVVGTIMGTWLATLLWPGTPPFALLVALVLIVPVGGPASMVAFEVVRTSSPRSYLGVATGVINSAGFTSALLVMLLIGLVLDLQGAGSPEHYSLTAFRWAFLIQVPFWTIGLIGIIVEFRRATKWRAYYGPNPR